MPKPKRRCVECKKTSFQNINGQYVCVECNTYANDQVETVYDEFDGPGKGRDNKKKIGKKESKKIAIEEKYKQIQSWDLYDGYNYLLVKMTDALIKCGADPKIKPCVHRLWASYLCKMEIAYCADKPLLPPAGTSENEEPQEVEEQPSIIPSWFSQNADQDSLVDSDDQLSQYRQPIKKTTLFAPKKLPRKVPRRQGRSEIKALLETADNDLSIMERRKKSRKIKSNYMKLALSGADTDVSMAESIASSSAEEDSICESEGGIGQGTRLSTMKHAVPECFPEGEFVTVLKRTRKSKDYTAPRTTCNDPEYITMHKLLSFFHIALLMKGQLISYAELTRWIREGFIPFYGAHQLLPPNMPLSRYDAQILGVVGSRANGAPSSRVFRQNTARLLAMLGIETIPKPPVIVVASKIICDLQLPNELEVYVRAMDRIVHTEVDENEWKHLPFGDKITSENVYAGVLVLISMKFIFGLDGVTEFKISDFAEKVNNLLKLKPSSGFARQQHGSENASHQQSSSDMKALFVWKEWVRYIEYRRFTIERTHVPTAIRKGVVKNMDPEYVLRFAQNEGYYHFHRPSGDLPEFDKSILEIFEKASARFASPQEPRKRIPRFRPSLLGVQGLAEQLLEFDSTEYGLFKQDFSTSSLMFCRKPKALATALKKANPSHRLDIHKGPASKQKILTIPLVTSRNGLSKSAIRSQRYGWKIVTIDSEVVPADTLSGDEEDDDEDRPSLLLYDPSFAYWVATIRARLISFTEWNLFAAGLSPNFLWMLNLICEGIEESPRDFYEVFNQLETIIFLHNGQIKRSLSEKKDVRKRIMSAMQADF